MKRFLMSLLLSSAMLSAQVPSTAAEVQQAYKEGRASLLVINTTPPGASISVDGQPLHPTPGSSATATFQTPVVINLFKKDAPRVVVISLEGYKSVERQLEVTGKPIAIEVTLEASAPTDEPIPASAQAAVVPGAFVSTAAPTAVSNAAPTESLTIAKVGLLTDAQVDAAIQKGFSTKPHKIGLSLTDQQTAIFSGMACKTCGQSGYMIRVFNPEQWIGYLAAHAKSEMMPFTVADVSQELRMPHLHVIALPSRAEYLTGAGLSLSSSVHRVVLNDTSRQTTIQPLKVEHGTMQGQSAFRSAQYTSASVEFPMSSVAQLRQSDPKGEFFIVVVGDRQNKFFKIKERSLSSLF
jgi:hypothetical protein